VLIVYVAITRFTFTRLITGYVVTGVLRCVAFPTLRCRLRVVPFPLQLRCCYVTPVVTVAFDAPFTLYVHLLLRLVVAGCVAVITLRLVWLLNLRYVRLRFTYRFVPVADALLLTLDTVTFARLTLYCVVPR